MKRVSLLLLIVIGMMLPLGCSEGRRGVSFHGPIHDVNLAYDVNEDDFGHRDVELVRVIERR
jgi:hypothetical protein